MKKIVFGFFIASSICFSAIAQKQTPIRHTSYEKPLNEKGGKQESQTSINRSCPELLNQLTEKFGKNFSLKDPKVIELLKANMSDNTVSPEIKKMSIYIINSTSN